MSSPDDMISTSGVVLVRESDSGREVFLSRRPDDRSFLGGFHGFFIGRAEDGDGDVPLGPDRRYGVPERGAWGCAARELFEEAGLLPLREGLVVSWKEVGAPDPPGASWSEFRRRLRSGDVTFGDALRAAGYRVDTEAFDPVGEWETPSWSDFDSRTEFYVCRVSSGRLEALSAHVEADEHRDPQWVSTERVLEHWSEGRWFLSTPIRLIVEGLRGRRNPGDEPLLPTPAEQTRRLRETIQVLGGLHKAPLRTATLPPATHTNCWVVGDSRVLIVDPGSGLASERDLLESLVSGLSRRGTSPHAVVLTHHHDDHVGGVAGLREAFDVEVWAHSATIDRLELPGGIDRTLSDGERLAVDDDHPLRVLHTPGHAPGHLALLHEPSRCLIGGDLVASEGTILVDPEEGDMGEYLQSLARVDAIDLRAILPAHGVVITDPHALLQEYRDHRWDREAQVLEALRDAEGPARPDDLVATVYADEPTSVWPIAVRSLEAHLLHLVDRDLARRVGDAFVPTDASGGGGR